VSLEAAVAAATGSAVVTLRRVGGGDINDAYRAELADGRSAFVKTRPDAPAGEYAAEAAALRWLAEPGALGVPAVLGYGDELLALEWLEPGGAGDETELGAGLAHVHAAGAERFGGDGPLRIGRLELPNQPLGDWPEFYAERRLRPLVSHLSASGRRAVEAVCDRIADLAGPPEPPARLHGDLWSGNVLWSAGRPYLIDSIAYGGHRVVDPAMLQLFGEPGARFFAAYEDVTPLADGWQDRVGLYQLFPLLVHAALFGGGYAGSVERTARHYAP
jgi:fructosamine-3-kinase